jgi:hypothetical protein
MAVGLSPPPVLVLGRLLQLPWALSFYIHGVVFCPEAVRRGLTPVLTPWWFGAFCWPPKNGQVPLTSPPPLPFHSC